MLVGSKSLHSRSYAKKYKKRSKVLMILAFVICILFIIVSWWITNRSPLVLQGIDISGTEMIASDEVRVRAESILTEPFLVWSRNNALLAPRAEIERALEDDFTWIKHVDVEVRGISRLGIAIEEYGAIYALCDITDHARCFLSDDDGYIFTSSTDIQAAQSHIVFFEPITEDPVGTHIIPRDEFAALTDFIQGLKDADIVVDHILIQEQGEARVVLNSGTEVIIDRRGNLDNMLGHLLLLLAQQTQIHKTRDAFLQSTEYIDVRYGNKVFYKSYGSDPVSHGNEMPEDNTQE